RAFPAASRRGPRLRPRSNSASGRKTPARSFWPSCRRSRSAIFRPCCLKESDMADQPRRPRTLNDARTEAEAAFKKVTAKVAEAPPTKNAVPGVKEQVTLRIDQDVLEHFQQSGPGWQDRINEALRKAAGK